MRTKRERVSQRERERERERDIYIYIRGKRQRIFKWTPPDYMTRVLGVSFRSCDVIGCIALIYRLAFM